MTEPLAPPTADPDTDLPTAETDVGGAAAERTCPTCGRRAGPDDRFCEADGTPLDVPGSPMTVCACGVGKGMDGGDGFCATCGMRLLPAAGPGERGDAMSPAPDLGAATHVGRTHDTDEDAVAVGRRVRDGKVLHAIVVCDGVSSSSHGEQASAQATAGAIAVLLEAADSPVELDPEQALRDAVVAAHRAACEAGIDPVEGKDPPGTTLVAALAWAGRVDVAWVGDSRAYLIGPPERDGSSFTALALTRDHSWVNMMVDAGQMTQEEAMHAPYAHALTHCIGPLETPDGDRTPEPSLGHVTASPGSRLVVCSDGLWNYAPEAQDISDLLAGVPPGSDARTTAWALVHRALAMGGHDDVTVAIAVL